MNSQECAELVETAFMTNTENCQALAQENSENMAVEAEVVGLEGLVPMAFDKSTIKTSDLIEASSMLAYDEEDNDGEGLDYIIQINMETEFQISRRIVELCRYLSCYNISTKQWFYFDGIRWCKDSKNNIYAHVSENFARLS